MWIWRRWSGKLEQPGNMDQGDKRPVYATKHEEAQLRAELRQLLQQRQMVEQRGCFSDRELADKDGELEQFDRRIQALKTQQFRLRTQGKSWH